MFINTLRPQVVWDEARQRDVPAFESSHLCGPGREQALVQQLLYRRIHQNNNNRDRIKSLSSRLSCRRQHQQHRRHQYQHTMDDNKWFPHMTDSGDENYLTDDLYGDSFPSAGWNSPNRYQTAPGYVSGASGKALIPSQPIPNKEAQTDHAFWPTFSTTVYSPSLGGMDHRQHGLPLFGEPEPGSMIFQDGLPSSIWDPSMPMLDETTGCSQITTPGTAYSSFSSSGASTSDAMASMSLGPLPSQGIVSSSAFHHAGPGVFTDVSPGNWDAASLSTVSPKLLRINPSPAPPLSSSAESSFATGFFPNVDGEFGGTSSVEQRIAPPSKRLADKTRKSLPDRPRPKTQHSGELDEPESFKGKPSSFQQRPSRKALPSRPKLPDIQPKLPQAPGGPSGPQPAPFITERSKKDDYLINMKAAGLTYREIRRQGRFTEAESTLRGRYRSLTKNKEARVRKPEWEDIDIRLLKKATRKFAVAADSQPPKIPWKQVAEYIVENGGSYRFGNATCRKKWDELVEEGKASLG